MRNNRLNYVIVGAFVTTLLAVLVITVALLSGRTGGTENYHTRYKDATGLKFGSQVLYMGYPVGQVSAITPVVDDGQVRFDIELAISESFKDWKVPADSVAKIKAAGLLAAITIDIRSGESATPLMPGDVLTGVEQSAIFDAMTDTANTIKRLTETDVKPLLKTLNHSVQVIGAAVERDGAPLLVNLNRIAGSVADNAPSWLSASWKPPKTFDSLASVYGRP